MLIYAPVYAQASEKSGTATPVNSVVATALVRDTLGALNQANFTGNYSVFRDYASPNFSSVNDPVRLTTIFAPIRAEHLDLLPALVMEPVFTRIEMVENGSKLRLSGSFQSLPRSIRFDLLYEIVNARWKLFGIGVSGFDPNDQDNLAGPVSPSWQPARFTIPKLRPGMDPNAQRPDNS